MQLSDLKILHHFGGGVYAKEIEVPAGQIVGKHIHTHDHLSILGRGSVIVRIDGESRRVDGPACILIEAGKAHSVESLTDVVWFCVHATKETDPEKVDHTLIEEH